MADIVAGDDKIASVIGDAAHKQMDMGIVRVPMIHGNPFELRPKIALHLRDEIACEPPQVGHLRGILRRDREPEVVTVVLASLGESRLVRSRRSSIEHPRGLTVPRYPLSPQIGDVGGERRRTKSPSLVADDASLHNHSALRTEEPCPDKSDPAATESRARRTSD